MSTDIAPANPQTSSAGEEEQKCAFKFKIFRGLLHTLLHSAALLSSHAIIQNLKYINSIQLCAIRSFWVFLFCLPVSLFSVRDSFWPKDYRLLIVFRGILMGVAMCFQIVTLKKLPLVETAIISSSVPAFMSLAARFYLKEPCSVIQILALLLTLCGILFSVRLPELLEKRQANAIELSQYMQGLLCAILYVLFFTAGNILLGKIRHIHFTIPLMISNVIIALENGIIGYFMYSYEPIRCGSDQLWIMLLGVLFFISGCSIILAFQVETISEVIIMKNSFDITLSPVFQILIFGQQPNVYNLYGGVLVLSSTYVLCAKKIVASLPDGSRNKDRFKFLLK